MGIAERCRDPSVLPELGLPEIGGLPSVGLASLPGPDTSLRNWSLFIIATAAEILRRPSLVVVCRLSSEKKVWRTRDDARLHP
jgi:hypothetical protein